MESYSNNLIETGNYLRKNLTLGGVYTKFSIKDENTKKERADKVVNYVGGEFKGECKHMPLTKDQLTGAKKLTRFLLSTNPLFGFYGYAGTGKTTTIVRYISYMLKHGYLSNITFTSTTNKSLLVIELMFNNYIRDIYWYVTKKRPNENMRKSTMLNELSSNGITIKFKTLHQTLGLVPVYNENGDLQFICESSDKIKSVDIIDSDLLIIDECSMVSVSVLDYLMSAINKASESNPKIMFTGDKKQLPPVGEEESLVFGNRIIDFEEFKKLADEYFYTPTIIEKELGIEKNSEKYYKSRYNRLVKAIKKMKHFTLTNIVRSTLDEIQSVSNCIRNWIDDDNAIKLLGSCIKGNAVIACKNKGNAMTTDWFQDYLRTVKKKREAVITAWTNKICDKYNHFVRKKVFGSSRLDEYVDNEIVVLKDNYTTEDSTIMIYTSEQLRLTTVSKERYTYPAFTIESISSIPKTAKPIIDKCVEDINTLVQGVIVNCFNFTAERCSEPGIMFKGYTLSRRSVKDVEEIYKTVMSYVNSTSRDIKKLKINKKRLCKLVSALWNTVNTYIYGKFAKMTYGYAITCHKSQGSSYENVYVDIDDILKNSKIKEGRMCLYTAVTRSVKKMYLLVTA